MAKSERFYCDFTVEIFGMVAGSVGYAQILFTQSPQTHRKLTTHSPHTHRKLTTPDTVCVMLAVLCIRYSGFLCSCTVCVCVAHDVYAIIISVCNTLCVCVSIVVCTTQL